jgi:polypeptide N-acetylgalactosaminyltransferase
LAFESFLQIGDISARVKLKADLQCHDFQWYLSEVFPELRVPDNEAMAWGEMKNAPNMCADSLGKKDGNPLGMYDCHGNGACLSLFRAISTW